MPIKRIKQKGGDYPSPWGYNEGTFFVVERPGQITQQGGKSFPTKEETDSTCNNSPPTFVQARPVTTPT